MNKFLSLILFLGMGSSFMSCSSNGNSILGDGAAVEVSGTVYNVDTSQPVGNVKVYLLDNEEDYSTTTDSNGAFSMQIPSGSKFVLVTDDGDDATTDEWIAVANHELFTPDIDAAITNYRIHACPRTGKSVGGWDTLLTAVFGGGHTPAEGLSSVEVWDNFLANSADSDTLFSGVTSAATSKGIISMVVLNGDTVDPFQPYVADLKIETTDSTFGPIAYLDALQIFNLSLAGSGILYQDAAQGPDIALASATKSTVLSQIASFGKPGFSGDSVGLTFANEGSTTITGLPSTATAYVKPGMISLFLWGVDAGAAVNFETAICAFNPAAPGC